MLTREGLILRGVKRPIRAVYFSIFAVAFDRSIVGIERLHKNGTWYKLELLEPEEFEAIGKYMLKIEREMLYGEGA